MTLLWTLFNTFIAVISGVENQHFIYFSLTHSLYVLMSNFPRATRVDVIIQPVFLSLLRSYVVFRGSFESLQGRMQGGCHCCQCSTPKWLTLISNVEFSFLKMLRTRLSNLTKMSETLTSLKGNNFSCCPVFSTIRDSVQCTKCASLFQIF